MSAPAISPPVLDPAVVWLENLFENRRSLVTSRDMFELVNDFDAFEVEDCSARWPVPHADDDLDAVCDCAGECGCDYCLEYCA